MRKRSREGSAGAPMNHPAHGGARQRSLRSLADIVNRTLDPLVLRKGFGEAALLLRWETIVGRRIAQICEPVRLKWPPKAKSRSRNEQAEPATLVLRVEPGFGLDVQHMNETLIERVNAHLGWRCVERVVIRQEPLAQSKPLSRDAPQTDPAARAKAAEAVAGVDDDALRQALIALGERALAKRRRR